MRPSVWIYCRYVDIDSCTEHNAITLLQVKLKPGSYKMGKSMILEQVPTDPVFNGNVEWMTEREGVHHIYGVLVKLIPLKTNYHCVIA